MRELASRRTGEGPPPRVRPEAVPEAAAQAAGADGKNAVVKAYHSNIITTESVSTGKKNLKIIA